MKTMADTTFEIVVEKTPRRLLDGFLAKGVEINIDPDELTDEECKTVCRQIYESIKRRDAH